MIVENSLHVAESEISWSRTEGIPAAVAAQAERYHVRLMEPLGQGMFGKVYKGVISSLCGTHI